MSSPSKTERFSGVLAPAITPFRADLSPDPDMFIRHCQWLVSQGVNLAVFGTTSEANSMSLAEKRALLDALLAAGMEGQGLMPGSGACSITEAVELSQHAVAAGCRGVLMLPPFYYKEVDDEGLFRFYAEVIERTGDAGRNSLAIYLYNYPQMSQTPLSLSLIERLLKAYPATIAGIKDSSGDWKYLQAMLKLLLKDWPDFRIFCGSETLLLQTLQGGGAGCISATANVNPAAMSHLYNTWQADDALAQQKQLNTIRTIFESFPIVAAIKAATALYSGKPDWARLRPPLLPLSDTAQQSLHSRLDKAGFQMPGLA